MSQILHASCVSVGQRGLLILGRSGSGKSALTIEMLALGAKLVADDRTIIESHGTELVATAPDPIEGLVEMRGMGLLHVPFVANVAVRQAIDLDQREVARLPQTYAIELLGRQIPLFRRPEGSHLASALMLHLQHGFSDVAARDPDQTD